MTSLPGKPSSDPLHTQPPTNTRELHRRTDRNLIIGGLVIVFVVGGGLIGLLYGVEQALTAELCMGGLLALFGGVYWLILKIMKAISDLDDE
jgi:hypothetical protein